MLIRKIIVYTVILFVAYNLYVLTFKIDRTQPQSNFDLNITKAQGYLDEKTSYDYSVVGSSMGNRINVDIFPQEFYFLTFSGLSSFDGLEIIKQSNNVPKVIFIETNVMKRKLNEEFISDAINPRVYYLRKYMPSVLKKNKPTSVLHKPLAYLLYGLRNQFDKPNQIDSISKVDRSNNSEKQNETTNEKVDVKIKAPIKKNKSVSEAHFEFVRNDMNKGIPEKMLNRQMSHLKSYVSYFQSLGVTVVFYEMPVDKRLHETKTFLEIKKAFENEFPKEQYNYLTISPDFKVISNDGIHLTGVSIDHYSSFFKNQAETFKIN